MKQRLTRMFAKLTASGEQPGLDPSPDAPGTTAPNESSIPGTEHPAIRIPRAKVRQLLESFIAQPSARWIVLLLITTVVVGTAVYSYRNLNEELTAVALSRREAVARLTADILAEKFGRVVDVAISLSTRHRVQDLVAEGKWDEAIGYLRTAPGELPHIERLFLADVGGTLRADSPAIPAVRGIRFAHREWFRGVSRDWRPYVSPVYQRTAPPRLNVFAVAVPIKNPKGRVVGILVLQIRIENLLEWVKTAELSPDEFIYIVDSNSRLVFHSRQQQPQKMVDMSAAPIASRLRRGEHGVEIGFDAGDGEDTITSYAAVPGYGWGVVVQQPTRASLGLAARDQQLRHLIAGYGLILVLGVATVLLMARTASERQRREDERRGMAERERADKALRQSESNLKSAQRLAGIGNWTWDLRTDRHFWSEEIYRIYGRDPNLPPAVYPEVKKYFTPDSWARLAAAVETAMAQGVSYECDAEVVRADGSHRWITARGETTRAADGTVLDLHGTVQDITERKHAEEEIRRLNVGLERKVAERTAELEAANKELEAFSYSVSHDLRAPLRSIDGFSLTLLEDYEGQLDDTGKDHLRRVRAAASRMGGLIDDMLQLSRVTRAEMRLETVDLSALADSVVSDLKRSDPRRQIEVAIQPGLSAEGDSQLLRIALVNLLSNAWKFTGRQPAARIELGLEANGGERAVFVRDNGVGFDMTYVHKLFGAFQRLHTPSEFPGTGIGLATVQRIVHRHGGRVWAEGAVNEGATFYFALPQSAHAADVK